MFDKKLILTLFLTFVLISLFSFVIEVDAKPHQFKVVLDSYHEGCDTYHGFSFDEAIPSGFQTSRPDMLFATWPVGCNPWSVPQACWYSPPFPQPEKQCIASFEFTKDLEDGDHYLQYRASMKFPNVCSGTTCFQGEACWDAMIFIDGIRVGSASSCATNQAVDIPSEKVYFTLPAKEPKTPGRFGAEYQGSVLDSLSKNVFAKNFVASPIEIPNKFIVKKLGVWIRQNTGMQVALYKDDNGKPGVKVPGAMTVDMARIIDPNNPSIMFAHRAYSLPSPVEIPAGKYWIGLQGNSKKYIIPDKGTTVFTDDPISEHFPDNPKITNTINGMVSAYIEGELVKDTKPPNYENISVKVPEVYSRNFISEFSIVWKDDSTISKVFLESNLSKVVKNYTMTSKGNNLYVLKVIIPSSGTFYWRSIAFDLEGNSMSTEAAIFTVRPPTCSNKNYACVDETTRKYESWCEGEFSRVITESCKDEEICDGGQCIKENKTARQPLIFNCGTCEVGSTCECELTSECKSGLWIVKNKEDRPLQFPVISQTPQKAEYTPNSSGTVGAIIVCIDPEPTRINKTLIKVTEPGTLGKKILETPPEFISQTTISEQKESCPFECCVGKVEYNDKLCEIDRECVDGTCKPILKVQDYSFIGITVSSVIGVLILIFIVLPRV